MSNFCLHLSLLILIIFPNSLIIELVYGASFFSNIHVINVQNIHAASQGIAIGNHYLYLTTSVNELGKPENIISVYDLAGKFITQKRNASTEHDIDGRFLDFGDGTIIGSNLYLGLYNWNSLPANKSPLYSKIAVFNTNTMNLTAVYDVGGNTAEGVAYHEGHFWVIFHDRAIVKELDTNFKFLKSHTLVITSNVKIRDGFFEGAGWYQNDLFLNIHGPNSENSFYSPGLIRYHYNGSTFEYLETITPPTYGSGQGFDIINKTFFFVDRPANAIIRADLIEN